MIEQSPILGINFHSVKLDGIWKGNMSYPGKPSFYDGDKLPNHHKTAIEEVIPKRELEKRGVRFIGSTDDAEPLKTGNRLEEKTSRTGITPDI